MRIHQSPKLPEVAPAQSPRPVAASRSTEEPSSTTVKVSTRAKELASSANHDASHIAFLRAAVQNGTFQVDSRAIAKKLVGDDDGDGD